MELFDKLTEEHIDFIKDQKVFFVATGVAKGTINLSPKGLDSLRVIESDRILWMNLTGSGNETAAHVQENPRMTLMMNAFEGKPLILRIYGQAKVNHHLDDEWKKFKKDRASISETEINNKIELRPSNKHYSSIFTDKTNVKIDGKVVGLIRNY